MTIDRVERIPAENVEQMDRWYPPEWDERGKVIERVTTEDAEGEGIEGLEEIEEVEPLTAEQVEAIRQEAFEEGFKEGFKEGEEKGHEQGIDRGTKEGLENGFNEGKEKGLQEGHDEGLAAANSKYEKEWQEKLARFTLLANKLLKPIESEQEALEATLVNLVVGVARAVVKKELSFTGQQVQQVIDDAINQLPIGYKNLTLFIHPDDYAIWKQSHLVPENWKIVEENSFQPGGIKVKTDQSLVDYSIETRFQLAIQQLLDHQMQQDVHIDEEEEDEMARLDLSEDQLSSTQTNVEQDKDNTNQKLSEEIDLNSERKDEHIENINDTIDQEDDESVNRVNPSDNDDDR